MQPVELRTARLTLSVPVADDADALYDACQDPAIQRYTTVPSPYTRQDAEGFPLRAALGWHEVTDAVWALRRDGVLAGVVGLHRLQPGEGELGYWLAPAFRGSGLMTEAAAAVVDWGFHGPLALARVEWRAVVGNTGSAAIAQRLGFRYAGMLRLAVRDGRGRRSDAWVADRLPTEAPGPVDWRLDVVNG